PRRGVLGTRAKAMSSWQRLRSGADPAADPAGQVARGGRLDDLGDDADDRLGVAGTDVDPTVVPLEAETIATIRPCLRERRGDSVPQRGDIGRRAGSAT